jgi:hypothetical protein
MKALTFSPGIICILIGGYLASMEAGGYGWFLGLGAILALTALENSKN